MRSPGPKGASYLSPFPRTPMGQQRRCAALRYEAVSSTKSFVPQPSAL
jgi:hypothetical protein